MFHYFVGKINILGNKKFLVNDLFGIQVNYLGTQNKGEFFLYPHIDDNKKTIFYFCFDTIDQKNMYENVLKINGIGPKSAFHIVQIPAKQLEDAIKNFDAKIFQSIQGIGPKSAKKILLEMKGTFDLVDIQKLDIDQKLYKSIISSLKGFGYSVENIKSTLQLYDGKITKNNLGEVIKRVISKM